MVHAGGAPPHVMNSPALPHGGIELEAGTVAAPEQGAARDVRLELLRHDGVAIEVAASTVARSGDERRVRMRAVVVIVTIAAVARDGDESVAVSVTRIDVRPGILRAFAVDAGVDGCRRARLLVARARVAHGCGRVRDLSVVGIATRRDDDEDHDERTPPHDIQTKRSPQSATLDLPHATRSPRRRDAAR